MRRIQRRVKGWRGKRKGASADTPHRPVEPPKPHRSFDERVKAGSERLSLYAGLLAKCSAGVAVALLLILLFVSAVHRPYEVAEFRVAKTLEQNPGLTADILRDYFAADVESIEAGSAQERFSIHAFQPEDAAADIEIPHTKATLRTLLQMLRRALGQRDTHITVDARPLGTSFQVELLIDRATGKPDVESAPATDIDLRAAVRKAAETAVYQLEPVVLAHYYTQDLQSGCWALPECTLHFGQAIRIYKSILDTADPQERYNVLVGMSDAYAKVGEVDPALTYAKQAIDAAQNTGPADCQWTWHCEAKKKAALALQMAQVEHVGLLQSRLNHYAEAQKDFQKVRDYDPMDGVPEFDSAKDFTAQGDEACTNNLLPAAAAAYARARQAFQAAAWKFRARQHFYDEFEAIHTEAVNARDEGYPGDAIPLFRRLSVIASDQGVWMKDYANALGVAPSHDYNTAVHWHQESIALLAAARDQEPGPITEADLSAAYADYAKTINYMSGSRQTALDALAQAVKHQPTSEWPIDIIGDWLEKSHDPQTAAARKLSGLLKAGEPPTDTELTAQEKALLEAISKMPNWVALEPPTPGCAAASPKN